MAFQRVPETAEIDHIFTLNGHLVQNTHYAELPGGYNQSDLQALADKIDEAFDATYVTDVANDVSYVRTEVRGLDAENDLVAEQDTGAGPGTHTGASLPNNVSFSIKKSSGLTGRSARGRSYWIGVAQNELDPTDENYVESTYAAIMVADIDYIRASIAALADWNPVLVSRFLNKAKRTEGKTFPWIGTSNVDLRVDTNRGRLPST